MIVVIGGVTGAGKTLIGKALAAELGWEFIDADDYHPESNVEKMSRGWSLDDEDRDPWLDALNELLRDRHRSRANVVLACSALTREHRSILAAGLSQVKFVQLTAPATTVRGRLHARQGHFAGPELLASQLEKIDAEGDVTVVPNTSAVPRVVANIRALLRI